MSISDEVRTDIVNRVESVIQDCLLLSKYEPVSQTADLENDLGADELDIVEIVMEIESEFGMPVTAEEEEKIKTVKDVIDLVIAKHCSDSV